MKLIYHIRNPSLSFEINNSLSEFYFDNGKKLVTRILNEKNLSLFFSLVKRVSQMVDK